jgi:Family of unknown function (DUF5631)/Family of unknown function (DUF5632)
MTVPDYPPGQWSVLLVGAQWVSIASVTALNAAIANRGTIQANFSQLHEMLQQAITTTLAGQEGETADAIRDAFREGAEQAANVAEKNGAYKKALQDALDSVQQLRDKLTSIANDGNKQINDELQSKDELPVKVSKIAEIVADHQRQANQAAAESAFSVIGAGQKVVDAQGNGQSFFGMARDAGIDPNQQPNLQAIENQVRAQLNQPGSSATPPGGLVAAGSPAAAPPPPAPPPQAPAPTPGGLVAAGSPAAAPPPQAPAATPGGLVANGSSAAAPGGAFPAAPAGFSPGGSLPTTGGGAPSMGGGGLSAPSGAMAGMGGMGAPAGFGAPATPTPMGPPQGLNSGAPMSAPAMGGGAPGGPVQAMASQVPPTTPTAPTFPTAGTGTPVTVGETPAPTQAPATAVPSSPAPTAYTSEPSSPMMAAPAPVAAAPAAPAGPLPAYGSDLRPPTVALPPSPPPITSTPSAPSGPISGSAPASSAVPGSAAVHPSAGGGPGVGQPAGAVVRQPGGLPTPTPAQAPPGVGTESAIASAGGALAGAVSADATARTRLQRLVAAVADQQPRLSWAVGDRVDDTTILVTDLASGWIPPGIEIPSALTLLEPARRRGDIEALLGEVKLAAATQAGHYRPESDTDEPVPMSPRPRRAPEVEELNWHLSDATHFRDGLPRLAHTLARAASRGTGVLESEAEELHNQLTALADRVLDSYPDHVDAAEVGNWQLLAAIEALVNGDKTAANYHLAWFLTCNTPAAESIVR